MFHESNTQTFSKRENSILFALDSVHRSLLMNNLKYEDNHHRPHNLNKLNESKAIKETATLQPSTKNKPLYPETTNDIVHVTMENTSIAQCTKKTHNKQKYYAAMKNNNKNQNNKLKKPHRNNTKNNNAPVLRVATAATTTTTTLTPTALAHNSIQTRCDKLINYTDTDTSDKSSLCYEEIENNYQLNHYNNNIDNNNIMNSVKTRNLNEPSSDSNRFSKKLIKIKIISHKSQPKSKPAINRYDDVSEDETSSGSTFILPKRQNTVHAEHLFLNKQPLIDDFTDSSDLTSYQADTNDDDKDDDYDDDDTMSYNTNRTEVGTTIPAVLTTPTSNTTSTCSSNEYFDCSGSTASSNYEDTVDYQTNANKATAAPMVQIIQEMTELRQVTSTIRVNRKKASKFSGANVKDITPPKKESNTVKHLTKQYKSKQRKQCKQKIMNENISNEILDQTIQDWDQLSLDGRSEIDQCQPSTPSKSIHNYKLDETSKIDKFEKIAATNKLHNWEIQQSEGTLITESEEIFDSLSSSFDSVKIGKLSDASPKNSNRPIGRLLAKRLKRHSLSAEKQYSMNIAVSPNVKLNKTPPIKPPRTFASTSSSKQSSIDGGHSATTMAIDELAKPMKTSVARKLGWQLEQDTVPKPTCPTLSDFSNDWSSNKNQNLKSKIGWIQPGTQPLPQNIVNMLNYDEPSTAHSNQMTSMNLLPEPQANYPAPKEDIDTVDSPQKCSKNLNRFSTQTVCSTPQKNSSVTDSGVNMCADESSNEPDEMCKKCHMKIIKPSGNERKSFGKAALKRTKTFLEASKKVLSRSNKTSKTSSSDIEDYNNRHADDENVTPIKSDTTAQFNQNSNDSCGKQSVKTLGFTPVKPVREPNHGEEKKKTPPKKPIRHSLLRTLSQPAASEQGQQETTKASFNFDRSVSSPQVKDRFSHGFSLTPKKLFKSFSSNRHVDGKSTESYKAFLETDDGFTIFMNEYLRKMALKIENNSGDSEAHALNNSKWSAKPTNRIRRLSCSSDAIDYRSRHQIVSIDCHAEPVEPIYSEINSINGINRIMVNNDPKSIYSIVDKKKKSKSLTDLTDIDEVPSDSFKNSNIKSKNPSYESLQSIANIGTINLVDSIENLLEKMKETTKYQCKAPPTPMSNSFRYLGVDEPVPRIQCVTERLLCSAAKSKTNTHRTEKSDTNSISMSLATDSICDAVLNGERINDEIMVAMQRLERHLEPYSNCPRSVRLASSDSDCSLFRDDISLGMFSHGTNTASEPSSDNNSISSTQYKTPESAKKSSSPSYKIIKDKLRNSFRNGAKFFKSEKVQINVPVPQNKITPPVAISSTIDIETSDCTMQKLNNQIAFQRDIQRQLKNALDVCRQSSDPDGLAMLVEAERLLLISHGKLSAAESELRRIDYDGDELTIVNDAKCWDSSVTINLLEFPLKREEMYDTFFHYFYVCVCTYRDQVLSTTVQQRQGDKVYFHNLALRFHDMHPLYEIKIDVFVLRITKDSGNAAMAKAEKRSSKLFSFSPNSAPVSPTPQNTTDGSRFRLHCTSTIKFQNGVNNKFHKLLPKNTSNNAPFNGHVYFNSNLKTFNFIVCDQQTSVISPLLVEYSNEIRLYDGNVRGFVNVYDEKLQNWNRQWCWLNGCKMQFYAQPDDEEQLPIFSIDLSKCFNDNIHLVDRKLCTVPRTFAIDVHNIVYNAITDRCSKYFISTKTNSELILWLNELNRRRKFIKQWNI